MEQPSRSRLLLLLGLGGLILVSLGFLLRSAAMLQPRLSPEKQSRSLSTSAPTTSPTCRTMVGVAYSLDIQKKTLERVYRQDSARKLCDATDDTANAQVTLRNSAGKIVYRQRIQIGLTGIAEGTTEQGQWDADPFPIHDPFVYINLPAAGQNAADWTIEFHRLENNQLLAQGKP